MSLKGRALCLEPFLSPREERLILSYWASRAPIHSSFFPPGPGDCRKKPKINFPLSVVSGLQRHLQQDSGHMDLPAAAPSKNLNVLRMCV